MNTLVRVNSFYHGHIYSVNFFIKKGRVAWQHVHKVGTGDRIRTRNHRFWRPPLYQLSYTGPFLFERQWGITVLVDDNTHSVPNNFGGFPDPGSRLLAAIM